MKFGKQFANQINFHLYHYAGNNPVRYVDPDGRIDVFYQDDNGKESNTPFSITGKNIGETMPTIADIIASIASFHLNENYSPNNSCDEWAVKILSKAGVQAKNYALSNTNDSVKQHINELKKTGKDYSKTENGKSYVVFMGDGTRDFSKDHEHAGVAIVNSDGSLDFYHSSTSNKDQKSTVERYKSRKDFEINFAYAKFYYQEIKND